MLKNAMLIPIKQPTRMSVGKCTPNATRENPTNPAQAQSGINKKGKKCPIKAAIMNAADVCPDGKLNLSEGVIKLWKFFIAASGRLRLKPFFNTK